MTNLRDLGPDNCSPPALDAEARAIVDKFEELFSEAAPPAAPRVPQSVRDEFAIEFPDDDDPARTQVLAASLQTRGGRREPAFASPEKQPLKDSKPAGPRLKPFELPRAVAAADGAEALPTSPRHERLPELGSVHGRRKSIAIFAGIAVALLVGMGAGYIAGKHPDAAASAAKTDSSPSIGQTLRFDYELTQRSQSGKPRNPVR